MHKMRAFNCIHFVDPVEKHLIQVLVNFDESVEEFNKVIMYNLVIPIFFGHNIPRDVI